MLIFTYNSTNNADDNHKLIMANAIARILNANSRFKNLQSVINLFLSRKALPTCLHSMSNVTIMQQKRGTPVIYVYNSIPPDINEILNEAGTSAVDYDFETDDERDAGAGLGETDDESDDEAEAEEPKQ
jgi:hypothetical protein